MTTEPRCVRCGGTEDLKDRGMAPGMTYCAPCRKSLFGDSSLAYAEVTPAQIKGWDKPKDLDDEWPKAVRGFLILVIMVWLVFFSIIAMIHLGEILL